MWKQITVWLSAVCLMIVMGTSVHAYTLDLSNPANYGGQSSATALHAVGVGPSLTLTGNVWALFTLPEQLLVTPDMVLTFSYSSTELPEIAAVVFDTNTSFVHNPDQGNAFAFGGTDGWAGAGLYHPDQYAVGDGLVTYTVRLNSFLADGATFDYIILVNDDDAGGPLSNGFFTDVSISATPIPGAAWLLGSGLVGLLGLRRKLKS